MYLEPSWEHTHAPYISFLYECLWNMERVEKDFFVEMYDMRRNTTPAADGSVQSEVHQWYQTFVPNRFEYDPKTWNVGRVAKENFNAMSISVFFTFFIFLTTRWSGRYFNVLEKSKGFKVVGMVNEDIGPFVFV